MAADLTFRLITALDTFYIFFVLCIPELLIADIGDFTVCLLNFLSICLICYLYYISAFIDEVFPFVIIMFLVTAFFSHLDYSC